MRRTSIYDNLAVIAVFAFLYSAFAGRMEKTVIPDPMAFIAFGLVMGPLGLGILDLGVRNADLRMLVDLTLALILFIDASNTDMGVLKHSFQTER